MSWLENLLGKKSTIANVKVEDLRKERTRLEVAEQFHSKQLKELKADATKLFKDAVGATGSKVDDRTAARKMVILKATRNDLDRQASDVSEKLMAVDRLIRMKEREKALKEEGVWVAMSNMSVDELNAALMDVNVRDQEQRNLAKRINKALGIDEGTIAATEAPELSEIVERIQAARESGLIEQEFEALENQSSEDALQA